MKDSARETLIGMPASDDGAWTGRCIFDDVEDLAFQIAPHLKHGMNDQMHCEAAPLQSAGYRINDEWRVVVDDFQHRMIDRPAIGHRRWIEKPHFDFAGFTLLREAPDGRGHLLFIMRRKRRQIVGGYMGVKGLCEGFRRGRERRRR